MKYRRFGRLQRDASISGFGAMAFSPQQSTFLQKNRIKLQTNRSGETWGSVVLSDFDGTVTEIDTAEYVLRKFAQGDWQSLEKQFEKGQITLEECLKREFSLVKANRRQILDELDKVVTFRAHFGDFAEYCRAHHVSLIIVSAGLDFVINHYLGIKGWRKLVTTYIPSTKSGRDNIEFIFPSLMDDASINFKHDLVRRCKVEGHRVIYVGDGYGDYAAAKEADLSFAIKGSKLEKLCRVHKNNCVSVTDFQKIMRYLA